jgi:hypothetical protein
MRAVLRDRQDDPRLLYLLAGVYFQMGRPFATEVILSAYQRIVTADDHEYRSERYARAQRMMERLTIPGASSLIDPTVGMRRQEPRLGEAPELLSTAIGIYNRAPAAWRKQLRDYAIGEVLAAPAAGAGAKLGLVNPEKMLNAGIICNVRAKCSPHFRDASLVAAIAAGRLAIDAPEAGADCCAISLDDPDLRPADEILAEALAGAKNKATADDAALMNETLGILSRAALKHRFVLAFLDLAR